MRTTFALGLALGMLITGSINTISTKLADLQSAPGADGSPVHPFNHPFFQAALMFLGESLCLLVFNARRTFFPKRDPAAAADANTPLLDGTAAPNEPRRRPLRGKKRKHGGGDGSASWSAVIFLLPACCDMTGTSLMYVGLNLTSASVFQMLRGSVVLFTGAFSVIFLGRRLFKFHWFGMFLVLVGAAVVGVASVVDPGPGGNAKAASNPFLGNVLIVAAQVITAVQMVVEEKLINGKNIPALQAVGWEGVWGFSVLSCVLVGMYYAPAVPAFASGGSSNYTSKHFEDTPDALIQMSNNGALFAACAGNVLSIAFFNFFGLSVTKHMSATHRMVLDSLRTIIIWVVSLLAFGEAFSWLQLVGFVILLLGTFIYNEIFALPCFWYPPPKETGANAGGEGAADDVVLASDPNGSAALALQEEGVEPRSPNMDDFFSPKLSHYTQGRAM